LSKVGAIADSHAFHRALRGGGHQTNVDSSPGVMLTLHPV